MSAQNNGGPAFPAPDAGEEHFSQRSAYMGMTLRDYFAAKAMAAVISEPMWGEDSSAVVSRLGNGQTEADGYATASYKIADAMLKAREA